MHKKSYGFTFIELLVGIGIIVGISGAIIIISDPLTRVRSARDQKRLVNLQKLDSVIAEFVLDNKRYPDLPNTLRQSTVLPAGSVSLNSSNTGWIYENLSPYISNLPTDPLNNDTYFYSYYQSSTGYELNARLEVLSQYSQNDAGNNSEVYEVGSNLNLL